MKEITPREPEMVDMALELFWRRPDIMVVAAGSLPCIREVWMRARIEKALSRFRYVKLQENDYILGTAEDKIRKIICVVAEESKASHIILYLSCLDILTRIDFRDLETSLSEKTGRQVSCFFRGPLAKTDGAHHVSAEELVSSLTKGTAVVNSPWKALLPPASDMSGISDWMRRMDTANVIITPAGCRSCMRDGDMTKLQKHVYYTETAASDFIFGLEDRCTKETSFLMEKEHFGRSALIGSAVPSFIGFDGEMVKYDLMERGKQSIYFPADGFHDACYGVSRAEEISAKAAASIWRETRPVVGILGYSPLLCGGRGQYVPCIQFLEGKGYQVCFTGYENLKGKPSMNWVVSSAGLTAAQWVKDEEGVPYIAGVPVGMEARHAWKRQVRRILLKEVVEEPYVVHQKRYREKVVVLGDPLQTKGVEVYLKQLGFVRIIRVMYSWNGETRQICQSDSAGKDVCYISTYLEWEKIIADADIIIGDPILKEDDSSARWINFPWGYLGGRDSAQKEDGIMGDTMQSRLSGLR